MELLEQLATGLPDERAENQLVKALGRLPEAEKLAFINRLLASPLTVSSGLRLADRCLQSPGSMLTIITAGLERKNISILPRWIGPFIPRVGFRRFVAYLRERMHTDPKSVDNALYWMPEWIPLGDTSAAEIVAELEQELKAVFPPDSGTHSK